MTGQDERLAVALERCATRLEDFLDRFEKHEQADKEAHARITELEKFNWKLSGMWLAIGTGLAWLFKHF